MYFKDSYKRGTKKVQGRRRRWDDGRRGWSFEHGGRSPKPGNTDDLQKLEKIRK